jgi:hypothetical protein
MLGGRRRRLLENYPDLNYLSEGLATVWYFFAHTYLGTYLAFSNIGECPGDVLQHI